MSILIFGSIILSRSNVPKLEENSVCVNFVNMLNLSLFVDLKETIRYKLHIMTQEGRLQDAIRYLDDIEVS